MYIVLFEMYIVNLYVHLKIRDVHIIVHSEKSYVHHDVHCNKIDVYYCVIMM